MNFGVYDGISRWVLEVMDRQIELMMGFLGVKIFSRFVKGPVAQDTFQKNRRGPRGSYLSLECRVL